MGNVFGEKKTPKEIVREQKRMVRRSVRQLEREIATLKREEKKLIANIKKDAKKNQMVGILYLRWLADTFLCCSHLFESWQKILLGFGNSKPSF